MEIDDQKILSTWLEHQCRMVSGSVGAVLLTRPPDDREDPQAIIWPGDKKDYSALIRIANAAFQKQQAIVKPNNNQIKKTGEPLDALACPLFMDNRMFGVVAMEITCRSKTMQEATVQQVQAGATWLEIMVHRQSSAVKKQLINIVDLVAAALEGNNFQIAATEVANEIAKRFSCRRVSIGFLRWNRIQLKAMSHTSQLDHHSNMVRIIEEAMCEALDQGCSIVYPENPDTVFLATRLHAGLSREQHGNCVCTILLVKNDKPVGALLLERSPDHPFSSETRVECEQIGLLLGPILETRRRDERLLPLKILDSFYQGLIRLFGSGHLKIKLLAVLVCILIVWLSIADSVLRVSCDAVLEARIRRAVVAPQQGYLSEAHVRPGDLVRTGELLAALDDETMRLEQRKWQSEYAQILKKYRQALAGRDRAEIAVLNAQKAQAQAQLKLIEHQLSRTKLVAPFSGLVVKGDLSRSLGSPVARGDILYEIAPTDAYRVKLKVDERDIRLVLPGQKGQLKLSGIPGKKINITIDRVTPVSAVEDGRNYFSVEASMDNHSDLMRPGMEGIGKIDIAREKMVRIRTRRLVDWLRLFTWRWQP